MNEREVYSLGGIRVSVDESVSRQYGKLEIWVRILPKTHIFFLSNLLTRNNYCLLSVNQRWIMDEFPIRFQSCIAYIHRYNEKKFTSVGLSCKDVIFSKIFYVFDVV